MATSRNAVIGVLSNSRFRLLWFAQVFSQIAANVMIFLLALVIYQINGSNTAVSALYIFYAVPAVLFGFLAGAIVDRFDRKHVLLLCDLARFILMLCFIFISHNLLAVYVMVFIYALINQFYLPAEAPLIPKIVKAEQLITANSLFSFTYYSSMALGFILSGPLLRWLGTQPALLFLALCFLVAASLVYFLPGETQLAEKLTLKKLFQADLVSLFRKIKQELAEGITYVQNKPLLRDSLLLLSGTQVIIAILGTLGPGYADRIMHIDVHDSSFYIIGPVVLGIILGALWIGHYGHKFGTNRLIQIGVFTCGIILASIAVLGKLTSSPLLVIVSLFFVLGVANSFLDVPANSNIQKWSDGAIRGRIYGLLSVAIGGIGILPVIIGGILADVFGILKVIFCLGLSVLLYGVIRYNKAK